MAVEKIKIKVLTVNGQAATYIVAVEELQPFLDGGVAPGWISCETPEGWKVRLNLAHCVTVEQAAT